MPVPRFNRLVLVCLCGLLTARAAAAPVPDLGTPREKAEAFFNTVIGGDSSKAWDTLLDRTVLSNNRSDAGSRLRNQLQTALNVYGKPLGYDLIEEKAFGTSLVRVVYHFRLEKFPLTWEFFFYQNGRTCLPIDVRFNDRLDVYRYDRVPAADSDGGEAAAAP